MSLDVSIYYNIYNTALKSKQIISCPIQNLELGSSSQNGVHHAAIKILFSALYCSDEFSYFLVLLHECWVPAHPSRGRFQPNINDLELGPLCQLYLSYAGEEESSGMGPFSVIARGDVEIFISGPGPKRHEWWLDQVHEGREEKMNCHIKKNANLGIHAS